LSFASDQGALALEPIGWSTADDPPGWLRRALDHALTRTTGLLTAGYLLSSAALALCGLTSAIPWTFLPAILLVALPQAITLIAAGDQLERFPRHLQIVAALVIGFAATLLVPHYVLWCVTGLAVLWLHRRQGSTSFLRQLLVALFALTVGYGLVWNANYLCARLVLDRLHDADLLASDLSLYGWLCGQTVSPSGLYPIVRGAWSFALFERAYMMLFAEVILVLILSVRQGAARAAEFLQILFACYLLGLCAFLAYPAVGPIIYAPDTFDAAFADTSTARLMNSMATEFRALATGQALNGFGYFVALPSLHVAAACVLQSRLRWTPGLFWIAAPVNLLLVASTFLLGYHYFVDALGGIALAIGVLLLAPRGTSVER